MSGIVRTKKQQIIMGLILRLAGEGVFLSIVELHARLPYKCHYGSFRRSLRFLEEHQVITKEITGNCSLVKPTSIAYQLFSPGR